MNETKPYQQDFPISFDSYAAFDATSLKSLMQSRLLQNGTFTDQIYEGSNFNNLLDVIAYSYSVLLFYLNQTSNESLFSNSTIYENMNKIVKLINYKPVGMQSSILNFEATANTLLPAGAYTIPRFSYFTINDIYYSFSEDITFVKTTSGVEFLEDFSKSSILYQGQFTEHPIYIATGEDFEEVSIVSVDSEGQNDSIDFKNIFVFVRDGSGVWQEWTSVESLYLESGNKGAFEIRFNENQRYSIKFGNNIHGKKLSNGNLIAIYYLRNDKSLGNIGANTIDGNKLFFYNTSQYANIMNDVRENNLNLLTFSQVDNITFSNSNASTLYSDPESTLQIKENAPNFYKRQGRCVTTEDFKSYILNNFSNILSDVAVVNNWEFTDTHIRYLYNIGLKQPTLDSRVLYNQVNFADSCNFNNIYVYGVPKILYNNEFTFTRGFLGDGIKKYIINDLNRVKISTAEVIFQDPVYTAIGLGSATQQEIFNNELYKGISNETNLVLQRSNVNSLSDEEIVRRVSKIFKDYFSFVNSKLGYFIDIESITRSIYNVTGVEKIYTERNNIILPGLSFLIYNPVYDQSNEDISIINQNTKLPYFKIPYWENISSLENQIKVTTSNNLLLQPGVREY